MFFSKLLLLFVSIHFFAYTSTSPVITTVYSGGELLEGPHWSDTENALYWVDISKQQIHRLDADSGNITTRDIGYGPVSLVIPVKDYPKMLLVTVRAELYLLSWDAPEGDNALRLLGAVDVGKPKNRCNDGKVDAKGRLWFGTMGNLTSEAIPKDEGAVYVMDQYNHANPEEKLRPVSISNGIAWSSDNKFMYYVDSGAKTVAVYEFDLETGFIRNGKTLFSFEENNLTGNPDGMTIDKDGILWVANYYGAKVLKIDSTNGTLVGELTLPTSGVTSLTWGGADLSVLYVTTSKWNLTQEQLAEEPEAGSLFAVEGTGSNGFAQHQFVFDNPDTY